MYDTSICNLNSIFRRNPVPKETMVDFVDMISLSSKPLLGSLNGLIMLFAVLVMVLFLLWSMYCVMYCMIRSLRRWEYAKINDTDVASS